MTKLDKKAVLAERLRRQHLLNKVTTEDEYVELFRLMQPVSPPAFSRPGNPPILEGRAAFDDSIITEKLRKDRIIVKGRFLSGNVCYVFADQLSQYAAAFRRPLSTLNHIQERVLDVVQRTGPVNIHQIKSSALFCATALMIIVRKRYPRWWFDFARELERFSARVLAYLVCLTDKYPSTVDEQLVHLEIDYPDVENDLNQWMPLVKWFLAIPHYVVLAVLSVAAVVVAVISWLAILITGRYPKPFFDFVVGVARWALRVQVYAFLLVTDEYPPFSLK